MYRSLFQGYYRNTSLAILVYDISKKESYEGLDIWLKDIRSRLDQKLPIFIVGNKIGLEDDRKISFNEAKEFSISRGAIYFNECSSKTGDNIENIFCEVAKYLYIVYKESRKKGTSSNKLKIGHLKKKKKCF